MSAKIALLGSLVGPEDAVFASRFFSRNDYRIATIASPAVGRTQDRISLLCDAVCGARC